MTTPHGGFTAYLIKIFIDFFEYNWYTIIVMNIALYQICYLPSHFETVDPDFTPWDNLENLKPELCEYPIFEKAFNSELTKNLDYWGLLSQKFNSKSGISGNQFLQWIKITHSTQPHDVYFVNPVPIVESIFPGTIQHGENCHPGLLGLLQRNIAEASGIELNSMYMDVNTFSLCNYFIGNRKFWSKYIVFVNDFLASAAKNPTDFNMLYTTSANYGPNKSLPFYTFAVERLFSIFLNLERINGDITFAHYPYSHKALLLKTGLPTHIVEELIALTDIKQMAISAGYSHMMQHWAFFRNRLAQQNPYLFLME